MSKKPTYNERIAAKTNKVKDSGAMTLDSKSNDTETTTIESYDYDSKDITIEKKHEVVNSISGLIDINFKELSILDTENRENEELTRIVKENLNKSNLLQVSKAIVRASLLQDTLALRISGSILNPEIYIYDGGFTYSANKGDEDTIDFFQGAFRKNFGSSSDLVQEFYNFYDGKGAIFHSTFIKSLAGGKYKALPITRKTDKVWPTDLPIVLLHPILDESGNPTTIFRNKDYAFDMVNASYSKLDTYLKQYNFHILPNKKLLDKDDGTNDGADWIRKQFKKVVIPFNRKMTDIETNQSFEAFDPSQDNLDKVFSTFKKTNQYFLETFSVQKPGYESTVQKSVYEAELDKQEEKSLIDTLTKYYEQKLEKIINKWLPIGFKCYLNLKGFEVKDKLNDARAEEINKKMEDKYSDDKGGSDK